MGEVGWAYAIRPYARSRPCATASRSTLHASRSTASSAHRELAYPVLGGVAVGVAEGDALDAGRGVAIHADEEAILAGRGVGLEGDRPGEADPLAREPVARVVTGPAGRGVVLPPALVVRADQLREEGVVLRHR